MLSSQLNCNADKGCKLYDQIKVSSVFAVDVNSSCRKRPMFQPTEHNLLYTCDAKCR
uniref:Uncharacterized protein n=1 Tax=Arion vulgaris TaxID=1028688 RepID=A0A0B6Z6C7_9EUPU